MNDNDARALSGYDSVGSSIVKIKYNDVRFAPRKAHHDDACYDCFAAASAEIPSSDRCKMPLGFKLEIPRGFEGLIRPRSGLALKYGVTVLNSPGTIDSGYRGEVCVILINHGDDIYKIREGDRICQLAIRKIDYFSVVEAQELRESDRGDGGFGSTGR